MAIDKDKIVMLLRQKGPLVPNDIKRVIGGDTMIFGAVLSELSSRGMIKITKLKKGASPFYYLPGQEPLLERLIEFLNPKDQNTVRMLKEQKVIQESTQEMFVRVSLRNIPDFVRDFMVQTPQGPYRFWRYYLISETESMQILEERFAPKKEPKVEEKKSEEPKKEIAPEKSEEKLEEKKEIKSQPLPIQKKTELKPLSVKPEDSSKQQALSISPSLEKTPFYEQLVKYFKENDIVLISEEQIAKDREYAFVVKIPSAVGHLKMYVHARNKKKLNEGDVAPALLKSKTKDIPCLFLTNGEFTKKSLVLMDKDYRGLVIKYLK